VVILKPLSKWTFIEGYEVRKNIFGFIISNSSTDGYTDGSYFSQYKKEINIGRGYIHYIYPSAEEIIENDKTLYLEDGKIYSYLPLIILCSNNGDLYEKLSFNSEKELNSNLKKILKINPNLIKINN
jgi:hypothetical protein